MAAMGQVAVVAAAENPAGSLSAWSVWLIQQTVLRSMPSKSAQSRSSTSVFPYSLVCAERTEPPSITVISCMP